jgi:uncharacterized protein (TIGR02145 family)
MKKAFWINTIFFAAIIVFIAVGCKKEEISTILVAKAKSDSLSNPPQIVFNPNLNYGTVTDIEGNVYKTIQIGTQTWMAENLRTTLYADGSSIPLVTDNDNWLTLQYAGKAFCWFNNDSSNTGTYGALYTWEAAMNGAVSSSSSPSGIQGVCPTGWHLPSDQEWTTLANYLGGPEAACGKLKETGTLHWRSPNSGATNESGFTALPSGHLSYDAVWWNLTDIGFWYSSTKEEEWGDWYYVHYDLDGSGINRRVHP